MAEEGDVNTGLLNANPKLSAGRTRRRKSKSKKSRRVKRRVQKKKY
jgi:hypothetical protein